MSIRAERFGALWGKEKGVEVEVDFWERERGNRRREYLCLIRACCNLKGGPTILKIS
jgi:hypothetical protein